MFNMKYEKYLRYIICTECFIYILCLFCLFVVFLSCFHYIIIPIRVKEKNGISYYFTFLEYLFEKKKLNINTVIKLGSEKSCLKLQILISEHTFMFVKKINSYI